MNHVQDCQIMCVCTPDANEAKLSASSKLNTFSDKPCPLMN